MRLALAAASAAVIFAAPAAAQTAAELRLDGATYRFTPDQDRGDFRSPAGFTQRNLCGRNPALPHYEVCFRPDRDSARREVVFEFGAVWAGRDEPRDLGAHAVRILDGGRVLAEVEVPAHYWWSRWRWQSEPRPAWRAISELREAGLVPPYDSLLARGGVRGVSYDGPMDRAGVTKGMGNTGERCDIGLFTCHQAAYLLGDLLALPSVLAQGEAAGSVPWHFRDERTGAPVRFDDPKMARRTTHGNVGGGDRVWGTKAGGWQPDTSHQPALAFLPWALTGDPYFLEELQFQHAFNGIWTAAGRGREYGDVVVRDAMMPDQVRGVAWSTRTLAQLAATTPERTPSWLLPRSYYDRASREHGQALAWVARESTGMRARFHQLPSGGGQIAAWQNDMLLAVTSYALLLGREEYRPFRDWLLKGALARLGVESGWPRQMPTFYFEKAQDRDGWDDLWRAVQERREIELPPDPGRLVRLDWYYVNYLRGALALAVVTGRPEVQEQHDWLLAAMGGGAQAKWAFAAGEPLAAALARERRGR